MKPATTPRAPSSGARLLVMGDELVDDRIENLDRHLLPGDLVVLNDAATLPASLAGHAGESPIEMRLASSQEDGSWQAVLFGSGDWRTPTEEREPPPLVRTGEVLSFEGLRARVIAISDISPRLVRVRFDRAGAALWGAIYAAGRPIQYAYLEHALELWAIQTAYATRPWAVELPSAGRPLSFATLSALRKRGVDIATVTHAAGLSSTGDALLDRALPLPERFEIPTSTLWSIAETKRAGGRVIAVGTSVVRALEASAAMAGSSLPIVRHGMATLRIGPAHQPRVVDALLTGMHVPGESHYDLLQAFVSQEALERASAHATARGYLCHEFGDATLTPVRASVQRGRSDSAARGRRSRLRASWT